VTPVTKVRHTPDFDALFPEHWFAKAAHPWLEPAARARRPFVMEVSPERHLGSFMMNDDQPIQDLSWRRQRIDPVCS